ncbi:hypothetical protein UVI_02044000 [Ustilaginoidea virens]|uniref:DUF6604 domain-containing protein n=1 Tax=Ustilaginoidea virens TaxID=1159556 RepID=A0A1B5L4C7_USTVR|nr:hypothetical protein UVI_02044000 [Ustilaginoidea virens]
MRFRSTLLPLMLRRQRQYGRGPNLGLCETRVPVGCVSLLKFRFTGLVIAGPVRVSVAGKQPLLHRVWLSRLLVYLLVTASNALLTAKRLQQYVNKSCKLSPSEFIPAAQLIAKHVKNVPSEIFRVLDSVIKLRTACCNEFRRRAATHGSNTEMEESNRSHQHFVDILRQTFGILGGDKWLEQEKSSRAKPAATDATDSDGFQANWSNVFSRLSLDTTSDTDEESRDDDEASSNLPETPRPRRVRRKNKKHAKKSGSRRRRQEPASHIPLEQYGLAHDDEHKAAEYFLAASAILEQCIELRLYCQRVWANSAYHGKNLVVTTAIAFQAMAVVRRSQAITFADFPDGDSYLDLLNAYTNGGTSRLQNDTVIRFCCNSSDENCCKVMKEKAVPPHHMKELLMEYSYISLVEFVQDYKKTSSGSPTKAMQATFRKWDPDLTLKEASLDQMLEWRRVYTIKWLYDLVASFLSQKRIIQEKSTRDRRRGKPSPNKVWEEKFSFFGLGDFAEAVVSLTQESAEAGSERSITPLLVFQLQCIVDSFTITRGWSIRAAGSILWDVPPEDFDAVSWLHLFGGREACHARPGVVGAAAALADSILDRPTDEGLAPVGDALREFCDSFCSHYKTMMELDRGAASGRGRRNSAKWEADELALWSLSPFLCGSGLMQAIELVYRFSMFIWGLTPELLLMIDLHHELTVHCARLEPIPVLEKMFDWFGNDICRLDVARLLRLRIRLGHGASHQLEPFQAHTAFFKNFHMASSVMQTRSDLLVLHEADWQTNAVTPSRHATLQPGSALRPLVKNLGEYSAFDSRKHFTQMPKTGESINIPHFDPAEHIPEITLLGMMDYALIQDADTLSGVNFFHVMATLLKVWSGLGEGLKRAGNLSCWTGSSDIPGAAVIAGTLSAMTHSNDAAMALAAEVFEQHRDGFAKECVMYFGTDRMRTDWDTGDFLWRPEV